MGGYMNSKQDKQILIIWVILEENDLKELLYGIAYIMWFSFEDALWLTVVSCFLDNAIVYRMNTFKTTMLCPA